MNFVYGLAIVEALLLASGEPLPARRIAEIVGLEERAARDLCEDLRRQCAEQQRGVAVVEVAGGYQLVTRPDLAPYVEKLAPSRQPAASAAILETLAIIAYRQPVTRADIEAIRGVKADHAVQTLLDRGVIREIGRRESPGRPVLYGTTRAFLEQFGLRELADLPPLPERPASGPAGGEPEG